MIFYEPGARPASVLPHDPFKALLAPRPIGWISTVGEDGAVNLAPYSFFNGVCETPPMIAFSSGGRKDSHAFASGSGEFVWNMPTYELREAMNATSAELPRGVSEFAYAGLEMAASRLVTPPRVAASPAAFECRVVQTIELEDLERRPTDWHLVIGQIIGVHLDETRLTAEGLVDTAALRPIARCGHRGDYAVVDETFEMIRPEVESTGP